jgi:hypothetical protein
MMTELSIGTGASFAIARLVYENGAHSQSAARVTLTELLRDDIPIGSVCSALSIRDSQVLGLTQTTYREELQNQVSADQASYVDCQVGANPSLVTLGCTYLLR